MPDPVVALTPKEIEVITTLYVNRDSIPEIVTALNLLPFHVQTRLSWFVISSVKQLGLMRSSLTLAQKRAANMRLCIWEMDESTKAWRDKMDDYRFKKAMLKAIRLGLEKAQPGVVKDHRPFRAAMFQPVPHSSGVSSAAQECAEMGGR